MKFIKKIKSTECTIEFVNKNILRHGLSGFDVIGYIFLGSCITMAVILTATTLYYRRKLKKLSEASQAKNNTNTNSNSSSEPKEFKKKKKKVRNDLMILLIRFFSSRGFEQNFCVCNDFSFFRGRVGTIPHKVPDTSMGKQSKMKVQPPGAMKVLDHQIFIIISECLTMKLLQCSTQIPFLTWRMTTKSSMISMV